MEYHHHSIDHAEVRIKTLVQVIKTQIGVLQQLWTPDPNPINLKLLEIIHNLQSSIQNECTSSSSFVITEGGSYQNFSTNSHSTLPDPVNVHHSSSLTVISQPNPIVQTVQPHPKNLSTVKAKKKPELKKSKGRQRNKSVDKWKRNVNKERRMKGEAYMGIKKSLVSDSLGNVKYKFIQDSVRPSRKVGPRCIHLEDVMSKKALHGFECFRISEEERQSIFEYFWKKLEWSQRKVYISSLVGVNEVRRKRTVAEISRRTETYKYFLRSSQFEMVKVCKKFFLSTLNIGDRPVRHWVQNAKFPAVIYNHPESTDTNENTNNNSEFDTSSFIVEPPDT